MRFGRPLLKASFLTRENRFRTRVCLDGEELPAHLPNSGRLSELLWPGQTVLLSVEKAAHRLTDYDLLMVQLPHALVSVDARLPNTLFAEAIGRGALPEFAGLKVASPEFRYGESRLDFLLEADGGRASCLVEVKSVTLVQGGVGRFPDAVTERGRRHLRELRHARRQGWRAAVVFVLQRQDAEAFGPHDESDPRFGETLREVVQDGVEAYAYNCRVSPEEVVLNERVPVLLARATQKTGLSPRAGRDGAPGAATTRAG
jgi:sugar fermentation stimulation protein A